MCGHYRGHLRVRVPVRARAGVRLRAFVHFVRARACACMCVCVCLRVCARVGVRVSRQTGNRSAWRIRQVGSASANSGGCQPQRGLGSYPGKHTQAAQRRKYGRGRARVRLAEVVLECARACGLLRGTRAMFASVLCFYLNSSFNYLLMQII